MITQLIHGISKFDGTEFVEWQRTLCARANLVHKKISETPDGQLRLEPLYRTRRGRGRPKIRSVTTISLALADAMEGEEPTPGVQGGGQHEEISSMTVSSMATVPSTDELILANRAELVQWDAYNNALQRLASVYQRRSQQLTYPLYREARLEATTGWTGAAESNGRTIPQLFNTAAAYSDGQTERLTMTPNQDLDEYLTHIFQQRSELEHVGETFTEARFLDIILKGLSNEYESIRFAAERDPELSLKEIEITMRNMYANCVARGEGSTFSREKRRESAMTASSGFKGSCDCCSKPDHKQAQCFKFISESGKGPLPSSGAGKSGWCSLHSTHLHDNADCRAQQQQRGNGNGSGYNRGNKNNGNRRPHGDGSNTGRANTAVAANAASSLTVIAPAPAAPVTSSFTRVAAPPAPATPPPTPVTSEAAPTPYVIESPPSGIGFSFLADSSISGPLKSTMTSDCGASSHFSDSTSSTTLSYGWRTS